jgi:hypothetical protein
MAIVPISSVKPDKNHSDMVSFGHRKNDKRGNQNRALPSGTNTMKAIPVVVLMAMNPSLLNAKQPVMALPVNSENMTEMYVPSNPKSEATYIMAPEEMPQSSNTVGGGNINADDVQYQQRFTSNGKNYTMYFIDIGKSSRNEKNLVSSIRFVPDGYRQKYDDGLQVNTPPQFLHLMYHDLGDDNKSFAGAFTREKDNNGDFITREIRLPDDVANKIVYLLTNHLDLVPIPGLKHAYTQVVNTPDLAPTTRE